MSEPVENGTVVSTLWYVNVAASGIVYRDDAQVVEACTRYGNTHTLGPCGELCANALDAIALGL